MAESKNGENQSPDNQEPKMPMLVTAGDMDDYASDDADIEIDDEDVEALMEEHKDDNPELHGKICAAKSSSDKSLWDSVLGMAKSYLTKAIKKQVSKTINSAAKKITNTITGTITGKSSSKKKTSSSSKKTSSSSNKKASPPSSNKEDEAPAWVAIVKKFMQMCSTPDKKKMVSTVRISSLCDEISGCLKKSKAKQSLLEEIMQKLEPRAQSEQKTQEMPIWADLVEECRNAIESC